MITDNQALLSATHGAFKVPTYDDGYGDFRTDMSGSAVAGVGDINGDGIDDVAIGAPYASPSGGLDGSTPVIRTEAGATYVVYGSDHPGNVSVAVLTPTTGFTIIGAFGPPDSYFTGNHSGHAVAGAGDVNHDGLADIAIGAPDANSWDGMGYVIYGSRTRTLNQDLNRQTAVYGLTYPTGYAAFAAASAASSASMAARAASKLKSSSGVGDCIPAATSAAAASC